MTLNELQIDDVFEYGSYTLKLKNITLTYYISDIISSIYPVLSKKLYLPRAMNTLDQYQCKLTLNKTKTKGIKNENNI